MADAATSEEQGLRSVARWLPAVLLVVVVPLAVLPGLASPFHSAKWAAVCGLVPLGLLAAAATGRLRWPHRTAWAWWLGANVVAALVGVAPRLALFGSPGRDGGLLALALGLGAFVLGASVGADPAVARRIVRAALATGGVVGVLAIADRLGAPLPALGDDVTRARSSWGSATFAAGHLVLVAPLAVVHLRAADHRWRRIGLTATVAMAIGLVLTGTRGAWVGAVVAGVLLAPALRRRAGGAVVAGGRASLGTLALIGAGAVGLVLAVAAVAGPTLERPTGGGRLDLWATTPAVVADRPVFGSGPDTQRIVLPSGIDDEFERRHGSVELHDRAHDLLLDTAVTTGLVGVLALGWLLLSIGRDVRGRLGDEVVARAIAAGLVGYLVHLLFAFGDATLDPLAWLLAGLLVVALPGGAPRDEVPARQVPRPLVLTALGVATVVGLGWGASTVIADRHLDSAVEADARGDRTAGIDSLDAATGWAPWRMDLWQARARIAQRLLLGGSPTSGEIDPRSDPDALRPLIEDALDDVDRALRIAPGDPDLLLDRASLLDAAGRHEEARVAFLAVLDGPYPSSSRAWLGLGTSEVALGDPEAAIEAWERSADLAPRSTSALLNIGIAHQQAGRDGEAIDAFEQVLVRDPDDGLARQALEELGAPADPPPGD